MKVYIVTMPYGYGYKCVASTRDKAVAWAKDYCQDMFFMPDDALSVEDNEHGVTISGPDGMRFGPYIISEVEPL